MNMLKVVVLSNHDLRCSVMCEGNCVIRATVGQITITCRVVRQTLDGGIFGRAPDVSGEVTNVQVTITCVVGMRR